MWHESPAELQRFARAVGGAWDALPPARRGRALLVDNGSGPVAATARRELAATLDREPETIALPRNVGPTRARNAAFARASGGYVAALDADGAPEPDLLDLLVRALDDDPGAALAAASVVSFDASPDRPAGTVELEWGPAGATVYRRRALEELGGFDELFEWTCEDMDFGYRARAAGWRCVGVPAALFRHEVAHKATAARTFRFVEFLMVWRHVHFSRAVTLKSWLAQVPHLAVVGRQSGWPAAAGGVAGLFAYLRHIPAAERRRR